jgi:branched-subunit amino acid aminotransferase/4-amino-4-deoxychorismate lyase
MIFEFAVLNGQLLPVDQAKIPVNNGALLASYGVYETMKVVRGRPFYGDEHLERLLASAALLEIDLHVGLPALRNWFNTLADVDRSATWSLRIVALGAAKPGDRPLIAMWAEPLPTYPDKLYRDGAAVTLFAGQRPLPACKSLNTLVNFLARRAAQQAGALEGLLHHNGHLTEGARSNIFAVRQGRLVTPPAADVLSGITRDIVFQVMHNSPHPVVEDCLPADVSLYDEFFISSTSMHVMPVTRIDGRPVGDGRVGPITREVMARFAAHYRRVMELPDG